MFKYIVGLLLVLVVVLGISTYTLIGDVAVAKSEAATMKTLANKSAEAVRVASESCAASLKTVFDTQKAIDALNEARGDDLSALASLTQITLPETNIHGATKPTVAPKVADDLRLSPDTMRLLDNAYCSGAKADPYCTSR